MQKYTRKEIAAATAAALAANPSLRNTVPSFRERVEFHRRWKASATGLIKMILTPEIGYITRTINPGKADEETYFYAEVHTASEITLARLQKLQKMGLVPFAAQNSMGLWDIVVKSDAGDIYNVSIYPLPSEEDVYDVLDAFNADNLTS